MILTKKLIAGAWIPIIFNHIDRGLKLNNKESCSKKILKEYADERLRYWISIFKISSTHKLIDLPESIISAYIIRRLEVKRDKSYSVLEALELLDFYNIPIISKDQYIEWSCDLLENSLLECELVEKRAGEHLGRILSAPMKNIYKSEVALLKDFQKTFRTIKNSISTIDSIEFAKDMSIKLKELYISIESNLIKISLEDKKLWNGGYNFKTPLTNPNN
jgi:hypothetical protein